MQRLAQVAGKVGWRGTVPSFSGVCAALWRESDLIAPCAGATCSGCGKGHSTFGVPATNADQFAANHCVIGLKGPNDPLAVWDARASVRPHAPLESD